MIVKSVSGTTINIFDCNSDGNCTVKQYSQSFSTFKTKNIGVSLYRSKHYVLVPDQPSITSWSANGMDSVTIKWGKVSGADSYKVERRKKVAGTTTEYETVRTGVTETSFTDTGLETAAMYYYKVTAVNSSGNSVRSDSCRVWTRSKAPNVTAVSPTSVKITWDSIEFAESYRIDRRVAESGTEYATIKTGLTTTQFTDTGLSPETPYYYRVYPVASADMDNITVRSETSAKVTTPAVPRHAIDLNRTLDGQDYWELGDCGVVDIYIDGELQEDGTGVRDYWKEVPEGTRYEVKNIRTNEGYSYDGIKGGSLSGTVGGGDVDLRLIFTTHVGVAGVKLNNTYVEARVGESFTLTATIEPSNAENQDVQWNSSNIDVAKVMPGGRITTWKTGEAIITVKTGDGSHTASCRVVVTDPDPVNLTGERTIADGDYRVRWLGTSLVWDIIDHSNARGIQLEARNEDTSDQYQIFTFAYQDDGYYTIKNKGSGLYVGDADSGGDAGNPVIQWSATGAGDQLWQPAPLGGNAYYITPMCATNRVADVSGNQQKEGSLISLWVPKGAGNQAFELVPVNIGVTGISLNSDHREMAVGEDDRLAAFVEPETATNKSVTWESSDSSVVSVDGEGNIEALKVGTAAVTATTEDGGKTASCEITVTETGDPDPGPGPGPDPGNGGRISAASVSGSAGTTVAVPVTMEENPGVIGVSLNLSYDSSKVRLVKVESGELLDGSAMSGNYTKNPYKLSLSNDTSTVNIEDTGVLATAYFEILAEAGEGEAGIGLTFEEAYDKDLNEVYFTTVNGKITVQAYKPGDVNGDGNVRLNDAILLRRYVAGWDVEIKADAADVNRDGQVRLNDAILLRRYVAGWDVELK
ncbi:MAG: Ig-like domain-containing protein [Oscillospiraceae bacterium]|nr:Ig-like domain-containing protein [Oscillospiraceae bacterium]